MVNISLTIYVLDIFKVDGFNYDFVDIYKRNIIMNSDWMLMSMLMTLCANFGIKSNRRYIYILNK